MQTDHFFQGFQILAELFVLDSKKEDKNLKHFLGSKNIYNIDSEPQEILIFKYVMETFVGVP